MHYLCYLMFSEVFIKYVVFSTDFDKNLSECHVSIFTGGKHSMSNRKEGRKWRENTNQKAPDGFSRLEVFEKAATKKDDHNHPNSLQRVNYRNENVNILYASCTPVVRHKFHRDLSCTPYVPGQPVCW